MISILASGVFDGGQRHPAQSRLIGFKKRRATAEQGKTGENQEESRHASDHGPCRPQREGGRASASSSRFCVATDLWLVLAGIVPRLSGPVQQINPFARNNLKGKSPLGVLAGLVPAIHAERLHQTFEVGGFRAAWMPGTSPGTTPESCE